MQRRGEVGHKCSPGVATKVFRTEEAPDTKVRVTKSSLDRQVYVGDVGKVNGTVVTTTYEGGLYGGGDVLDSKVRVTLPEVLTGPGSDGFWVLSETKKEKNIGTRKFSAPGPRINSEMSSPPDLSCPLQ